MPNIKAIINGRNKTIHATANTENNLRECNCRRPADCPLSGKCLTPSVVYQGTVTTSDNNKIENYVGITGGDFKTCYNNHATSFRNCSKHAGTELNACIWYLKDTIRLNMQCPLTIIP